MTPNVRRLASLTALTAFAFAAIAGAGPASKTIKWQTDFKKAQAAAAKSHKLIMVDFYTEW